MDRFLNDFVLYTSAAGPVLFGAWAWWSWFRLKGVFGFVVAPHGVRDQSFFSLFQCVPVAPSP